MSTLSVLPSEHITCRVDESRDGKWMDPRLADTVICDDSNRTYSDSFACDMPELVDEDESSASIGTLAQTHISAVNPTAAQTAAVQSSLNHDVDVITTRASSWEPLNFCKLASHQSLSELLAEAAAAQYARDPDACLLYTSPSPRD